MGTPGSECSSWPPPATFPGTAGLRRKSPPTPGTAASGHQECKPAPGCPLTGKEGLSDESVLPWRSTWPGPEVKAWPATWGGATGTWELSEACTKDTVFYTKDHSDHKDPRKTLHGFQTYAKRDQQLRPRPLPYPPNQLGHQSRDVLFGFISTHRTHCDPPRTASQLGGTGSGGWAEPAVPSPALAGHHPTRGLGLGDRPLPPPGADGSEERDKVPGNRGAPVTPLGPRGAPSG